VAEDSRGVHQREPRFPGSGLWIEPSDRAGMVAVRLSEDEPLTSDIDLNVLVEAVLADELVTLIDLVRDRLQAARDWEAL
jgi:hypothetical protein